MMKSTNSDPNLRTDYLLLTIITNSSYRLGINKSWLLFSAKIFTYILLIKNDIKNIYKKSTRSRNLRLEGKTCKLC